MYEPCPCGRTTARMENLSGRTDDMLKIRGVNVFPSQIEEVLINTEGIGPNYEIVVDRKNHSDILTIKVEVEAESMMDSYAALEKLEESLGRRCALMLGLDAKIQLVSPNTLQRFEGKAKGPRRGLISRHLRKESVKGRNKVSEKKNITWQ